MTQDGKPTIEQMVKDLEALGWKRSKLRDLWESPIGGLYRGPFKAWCIVTGRGWPEPETNAVAGERTLYGPNHRQRGIR